MAIKKKDNSFIISTVLDNSSVKVDYKAWVFGIWAHKADGGSSILMSVITSTDSPDTISKGSGTPIDYNYKFITTFSNTKSLKIKMSSDTYATNDTVLHNSGDETATGTKTFQEIKISNKKFPSLVQTDGQYVTLDGGNTEIVPADNSKVVHTTGDETIDGKKKFDTDPTDSAGNAYAKTVDVNHQLDKKVNVADMRKPASDVAGIEEVNAKQDKISYTPADDSKVVHDNHDNTITANNLRYDLSKTGLTPIGIFDSGSFNGLPLGTALANGTSMTDGPDRVHGFTTTTFYFSGWGNGRKAQIAIADNLNLMYLRVYTGISWNNWTLLSDDSKVVHSADMRKPASDVVGLEDVPNGLYKGDLSKNTDLNNLTQEGIYSFGTSLVNFIDSDNHWGIIQVTNKSNVVVQYAICSSNIGDQTFFRTQSGYPLIWHPWTMVPRFSMDNHFTLPNGEQLKPADDSQVVHTADMRKPASDVAGIDEVNAKQDKIGYTPADDSKVAQP